MFKKCLGLLALVPLFSVAHPHAFIDMQSKVLVEKGELVGFSMQWVLDEPSSASIIYDLAQSTQPHDKQKLIDEAMKNIVNEHYFSYLFDKNKKKIKYKAQPQNYGMKSNGSQVMYYFDFLLSKPQVLKENQFELATYDPTYFVAMTYPTQNKHTQNKQSAVDFSQLPTQCTGKVIEPNVDEKVREYAASLDRSQRDEDSSLGEVFSQKVEIVCH
ncbi:zinc transporter binding subunit ZevA [Avibacterium sp. 21-586]|uniref:zinc transporter binding subunit ZevA n=1 Tax=Avibacterium sp. 21-586 TaxID=2911534 RepID=UPI002245DE5B|nr:zinc transporter binding subunit ZevA [Avibacterium sp. 21-586]MCW9709892.1 zinc transporter binding subunit ZevA [Avibacterium sp. 21-586]